MAYSLEGSAVAQYAGHRKRNGLGPRSRSPHRHFCRPAQEAVTGGGRGGVRRPARAPTGESTLGTWADDARTRT
jgi:hypothetical protein